MNEDTQSERIAAVNDALEAGERSGFTEGFDAEDFLARARLRTAKDDFTDSRTRPHPPA